MAAQVGHLVHSLDLRLQHTLDNRQECLAAEAVVAMGLQLAALQAAAAATAGGRRLQLRSLRSNFAGITRPLLAALPPFTRLEIMNYMAPTHRIDLYSSPWCSALQALLRLQHLVLDGLYKLPPAVVSAIGQMSQLTHLTLGDIGPHSDLRLLPSGLQELDMQVGASLEAAAAVEDWSADPVSLQHLTALRQLKMMFQLHVPGGVLLPAQPTSLLLDDHPMPLSNDVAADWTVPQSHFNIPALVQLQALHLSGWRHFSNDDLVAVLGRQPSHLQELSLEYEPGTT